MAMSSDHLRTFLLNAFPDALIELKALIADNNHFEVTITTKAFREKTRIQQHQMVYEALQGRMGTELHALSIKTQTPPE